MRMTLQDKMYMQELFIAELVRRLGGLVEVHLTDLEKYETNDPAHMDDPVYEYTTIEAPEKSFVLRSTVII